jgi:hypothetical protein
MGTQLTHGCATFGVSAFANQGIEEKWRFRPEHFFISLSLEVVALSKYCILHIYTLSNITHRDETK